jgi:hypothetical protein
VMEVDDTGACVMFRDIVKARSEYVLASLRRGEPRYPRLIHMSPVSAKEIRDHIEGISDRLLGMEIVEDKGVSTFELK